METQSGGFYQLAALSCKKRLYSQALEFIDNLSSEKLANGVNLADYPNTPQYQQAAKIMYLNEERI